MQFKTVIDIGILIQNKSVAHYTSQKAKYGGLFLSTKIKDLSYIFSLVAKSDIVCASKQFSRASRTPTAQAVIFARANSRFCIAGSYISLSQVILYLPNFHYK